MRSLRPDGVWQRALSMAWFGLIASTCVAQPLRAADALLAIDEQRASVVERIVDQWGGPLAKSSALIGVDDLRGRLMGLRADQLLAASLTGTLEGLRAVLGVGEFASAPSTRVKLVPVGNDAVYTPVTPCRLVDTRGTFAAVYQGDGTASHHAVPFAPNEVRSYTLQGGNGVCLTQLPAGLNPSAVQLQVFGMPTTSASGDIEILPQGATFGSTATMVYVGSIAFNTVSTSAKVNLANRQISVQVRGGGANVAIDVVGYFEAPRGDGEYFLQGGNSFGTTALLGTADNQPLEIAVGGHRAMRYEVVAGASNVVGGSAANVTTGGSGSQTIGGGGFSGTCETTTLKSGPCNNQTGGDGATVGGGVGNVAEAGSTPTVSGGWLNTASANSATVGGGEGNSATAFASAVGGGTTNTASGHGATVAGGQFNVAAGDYATVAGGDGNTAAGLKSFAAGYGANASEDGCILFAFWPVGGADCLGTHNQFRVIGSHGLSIDYGTRIAPDGNGTRWAVIGDTVPGKTIATWTNAYLSDGGTWVNASDRALKTGFVAVDPEQVLAKVEALPIMQWRYRNQVDELHLGPVAQDFHAAFGLGADDKHIATVDEGGVALVAIQALGRLLRERDAEIASLRERLVRIEVGLQARH